MKVVSFYQFASVGHPDTLRAELQALCEQQNLLGTILVASEGFNGTLAGETDSVNSVFDFLIDTLDLDQNIDARWTDADAAPFRRMRVKVKNEIVTMGCDGIEPQKNTGIHVDPQDWDALIQRRDVVLIDTRNHYEIDVGTFSGALDPGTDSFREFPAYAEKLAAEGTNRPLAMYCTGGIRCEKATALMQKLGFAEVYQLQGGILNYLDEKLGQENLWDGECFVFDSRVAVDRDLAEGGYVQCHACRRPLGSDDLASPDYKPGVSCPNCVSTLDQDRAERLEERRRQVELAQARGAAHIGAVLESSPKAKP